MCICIVLIQGNEKSLMKLVAASAKTLKTVESLPNNLFKIDVMGLCLLFCCCIFFKRQLKSVKKVFISEVGLANLKISEPIDA